MGVVAATFALPPLRTFLGLTPPGIWGGLILLLAPFAAVALSRALEPRGATDRGISVG
jgi:hypothetical protein